VTVGNATKNGGVAPVALVTGASRRIGIGAAVARRLGADGWQVATAGWRAYDERMPWGSRPDDPDLVIEADLADPASPARIVDEVTTSIGAPTALVMCHCESVDSSIRDTTVESFDRHVAVNARATWLLIKAFAERFPGPHGTGRIVAFTSNHVVHNLPYGASKAALDAITLAAARELADLGVTANVVNPGATDTGWMSEQLREQVVRQTPLGRVGTPEDAANLVAFLCSPEGGWINGQLLKSNGGG